ncbi:hypothetical protein PR048_012824 [Dryococelus australis]|uniref:HTH psq-type domain-containing protein n=1 Tax=Dryococelus australis TaxID=614101 RepID=A0ABQ9HQV5_9NEOP|nr:hypothetical protein PR048_012824 [Dryococelus australis]
MLYRSRGGGAAVGTAGYGAHLHKKDKTSTLGMTYQVAKAQVKSGELTVYRAAKVYGIPKPTLYMHVTDKRGTKGTPIGR